MTASDDILAQARSVLPPEARIVFASEVGSRSMGAETAGSDHDVVAFLVSPSRSYLGVHVPTDAYATIKSENASVTAFDIRHAVDRIRRGNARFLLASFSLVVHVDEAGLGERLRELCASAFVAERAAKQFGSMIREAIAAVPGRTATPRALLHVLHPALCVEHALAKRSPPPPGLRDLARAVGGDASDLVEFLLAAKLESPNSPVSSAETNDIIAFGVRSLERATTATIPLGSARPEVLDLANAIAADAIEDAERRERYGMGLMIGEMGEALAVLGNALRFGMDTPSGHGEVKPGERERLVEEMGDVAAATRWSTEAGVFDAKAVLARETAKFEKLVDPTKRDNLGRRLAPRLPGRD